MQPFILELIALAIIVLGIVAGAARGLLLTLYSLVKIILMIALAVVIYPVAKVVIPSNSGWEAGTAALIALLIAVVALGLVARLLRLVDKIPVIHGLNKLGGAVLGGVLGAVVVIVALIVICMSRQAEWCQEIYLGVEQSRLLMSVVKLLADTGIPLLFV